MRHSRFLQHCHVLHLRLFDLANLWWVTHWASNNTGIHFSLNSEVRVPIVSTSNFIDQSGLWISEVKYFFWLSSVSKWGRMPLRNLRSEIVCSGDLRSKFRYHISYNSRPINVTKQDPPLFLIWSGPTIVPVLLFQLSPSVSWMKVDVCSKVVQLCSKLHYNFSIIHMIMNWPLYVCLKSN